MGIGRVSKPALPFQNVVANGIATNQITTGNTLENLQLQLGGTALTKAMVSLFRMKANGKTIIEGTGDQLAKLAAYRGEAADAAFLDVQFADLTGYNEYDRMVGALDTTGLVSLTTEVTIAGATAPQLTGILHESAPQKVAKDVPAPFAGVMSKVLRYPFSVANGGMLPINLPFGPVNGAVIKRIHIESAGNTVTSVVLKQDGGVLLELTKAQNEYELKRWGRVPQANWFTLDFVKDGQVSKALNTRDARSLELLPTLSGADNGFVIVEYLDTLGNL